jgi:hypothetical protein
VKGRSSCISQRHTCRPIRRFRASFTRSNGSQSFEEYRRSQSLGCLRYCCFRTEVNKGQYGVPFRRGSSPPPSWRRSGGFYSLCLGYIILWRHDRWINLCKMVPVYIVGYMWQLAASGLSLWGVSPSSLPAVGSRMKIQEHWRVGFCGKPAFASS